MEEPKAGFWNTPIFTIDNVADFIENNKKKANVLACALIAVWLLIVFNWWSADTYGEFLFESPRLRGLTELFWFLIPWLCILLAMVFSRAWLKAVALFAVPVCLLVSLPAFFVIFEALDEVFTDKDSTLEVMDMKRIDSHTALYEYRFNPGAFSSFRRIVRTETHLMPGLLWVHTLETGRY